MYRIALGASYLIYDDIWHSIDVNGRVLTLSPTQYRLCRLFLATSGGTEKAGEMIVVSYRSRRDLEAETRLSHEMLIKHMSNLNTRCEAIGVSLCAFREGYLLIVSSDTPVG